MHDELDDTPPTNQESSTTEPFPDGRPLADVCRELGVPSRRGARWAQARQDPNLAAKRARRGGGSPQWWLSPAGAKALRLAMCGEDAVVEENRRLVSRLYESGIYMLGRFFPR